MKNGISMEEYTNYVNDFFIEIMCCMGYQKNSTIDALTVVF